MVDFFFFFKLLELYNSCKRIISLSLSLSLYIYIYIYIYREMIKTLTMHNNDTTPRHIGVEPTHWVPLQCALVLCHCCAQRVQGSLPIYIVYYFFNNFCTILTTFFKINHWIFRAHT